MANIILTASDITGLPVDISHFSGTNFPLSGTFEQGTSLQVIFNNVTSMIFKSEYKINPDEYTPPYIHYFTDSTRERKLFFEYEDMNTYSYDLSVGSEIPINDVTIVVDGVQAPTVTKYNITQNITNSISDCSLQQIDSGSSLTVNINAKTGYHFDIAPTATMKGVNVVSSQLENVYTFSFVNVDGDIIINATAVADEPAEQNNADFGFINIYNPSLSELQNISNKFFVNLSTGTITQLTDYIVGMFQIFGKPLTLKSRQNVKFGKYDTGVGVLVVREPRIEIDCGSVELQEKYHSALDYDQYVNARIWLPFCGFFDISSDLFMNGNCYLKYFIDVLTGKCVASLSSSRLDDGKSVIYNFCGNAMMKIPYYINDENQRANGAIANDVYNLADRTPYILVTRQISVTPNSSQLDGKPSNEYVKLGDLTGFTKCSEVIASGMISTNDEKNMIESLLKKGVIL